MNHVDNNVFQIYFLFRSDQHNKSKEPVTKELPRNGSNLGDPSGYFDASKYENQMTIVFHAVLAPHFNFEMEHGDKIFMRFGGVLFGEFMENVVQVHPLR